MKQFYICAQAVNADSSLSERKGTVDAENIQDAVKHIAEGMVFGAKVTVLTIIEISEEAKMGEDIIRVISRG